MRLLSVFSIMIALTSNSVVTPTSASPDPASASILASAAASACSSLVQHLAPTLVLTPIHNAAAYTSAVTSVYNPINAHLSPLCVVQPLTATHLSTTMRIIHRHRCHYAVRAGGHSGMPGWDATPSGVLIDLSRLTHFRYHPDTATVTVGPGLRWSQIYSLSAEYGVSPMGGRVGHVGTGLLLGGGLSLLSPMYGYACDGIVSVDLVTVEGHLRRVDAKTDPEWLRAIKGGGGRFGIVTSYTLRAFPTGKRGDKRWFGGSVTTIDHTGMESMVSLTEKFAAEPEDDPKATMLSNVGMIKQNGVSVWCGTTFLFYQGTRQDFERVFAGFLAIPEATIDVKAIDYIEASQVTPLGWSSNQAYKWTGGSLYPTPATYLSLWRNITCFLTTHEASLESAFLSITPVRTTQVERGYAAGGNALSPPRGKPFAHWLCSQILARGTNEFPKELDEGRSRLIRDNPSDGGLPLLLNEVDESQKVFETYGWYEGLKEVYKRTDGREVEVRYRDGPVF